MASATDVITLENFESSMPKWEPDRPNHLYALVDMGRFSSCSNGIRFSVSDLSPHQARLLKCVYRERAGISLFDALNSTPLGEPLRFPNQVIAQVAQTLARFKSIADKHGVPEEHISIFATEAMRKADNAASMLIAIREATGLGVKVLAPEVETLFGAVGARSGFTEVDGLFLDLGGGSVQMTYMNSATDGYEIAAAQAGESLPFGAARLIKILESSEIHAHAEAKSQLQTGMRSAFAKLQAKFPHLKELSASSESVGINIYLCGGGFRGYGSILQHNDPIQPYPIPAIGAYTVSGTFFKDTEAMRKINVEYNGKIFGMSKRRRQQFPAIATVVESLISTVGKIRTVTFCSGGNREGALLMKLPKEIRETSPLSLLYQPGDRASESVIQSVLTTIKAALPSNLNISKIPTIFSLGLGPLFVGKVWARCGEPSEANASNELHQAVSQEPSIPGFTHLARAVVGLTLCARWSSSSLGPVDQQLHKNLRQLACTSFVEASFWADYIGTVASIITTVCPVEPKTVDELEQVIQFSAKVVDGKKKPRIELTVSISADAMKGLNPEDLQSGFSSLGKDKHGAGATYKVIPEVVQMS
ncbi:Ppx/GppA phosphatase [Xylariales sp. PMI_506]|nr:Ppx/GppA phosphatase [Xylariales sp. PMI_506]